MNSYLASYCDTLMRGELWEVHPPPEKSIGRIYLVDQEDL